MSTSKHIWLLKDTEPVPSDDNSRPFRTSLLMDALVEKGHTVTWFTSKFNHTRKLMRDVEEGVHEISERASVCYLNSSAYRSNLSVGRVIHLRRLQRSFHRVTASLPTPDAVFAAYPSPEFCDAGREYAEKHQLPFFVDVRDPWPDIFQHYLPPLLRGSIAPLVWHYRSILRRVIQQADGVTSMSPGILRWALEFGDRKPGRETETFFLGLSAPQVLPAKVFPSKSEGTFSEEKPLICIFTGFFSRSYDVQTVIEAAQILRLEFGDGIQFVLVGDGEANQQLRDQSKGLPNVRFTGWLPGEELQRELSSAHVGLVPLCGGLNSVWFGNKLFEYSSQALVLISSADSDVREVIEQKEIGVHYQTKNSSALAERIKDFYLNPGKVKQLSQNSERAFQESFRSDVIYPQFAEHLTRLIECGSGRKGCQNKLASGYS